LDLELSAADRAFREQVRTWLEENKPRDRQPQHGPAMRAFDAAWQRTQYDGGWAGITWPTDYGGRGLSLIEQMIWFEEYAWADAPDIGVNFVGINHAGPTLIARAGEDIKAFHLPRILRGGSIWCQGFSEPGAGSDLAGLSTRAEVDGDELVVNGQKIWTSYAEHADYQELLVRTSRGDKRQHGITWVICDMHSPGITIRPIDTMAGPAHFCEVFYDDVRIPLSSVVGEVDDGWSVAMSTLSFERGTGFMRDQVDLVRRVDRLADLARDTSDARGRRRIDDDAIALRLATVRAEAQAVAAMTLAAITRNARSSQPGPESSMLRYFFSTLQQRVARLAMDILGVTALERTELGGADSWSAWYLRCYAATIAAGSKDIQRNIIGERVLGLPRGR
jgi:alkylation response protein AidB-like acyl-CoA dehydrogenase